ncbi:hypothetical protein CRYUN_Cryun26dG0125700 [Craigia yunnanensis]
MKKESEENKSKATENNNEKSAVTLDKLRRKVLRGIKVKDKQEEEEDPCCIQEEPSSVIQGRNIILVPNSTIFDDYQPSHTAPIAALAGFIGECSRPCEKRLTETDLNDSQTRLSLNKNHVQESMLPLLKENEDVKKGIQVTTYDSEGNKYSMRFVFWTMKYYVLTEWKRFYKEHGLEKDIDIVTVWIFRHRFTQELCFAITWRRSQMAVPTKLNRRKNK